MFYVCVVTFAEVLAESIAGIQHSTARNSAAAATDNQQQLQPWPQQPQHAEQLHSDMTV